MLVAFIYIVCWCVVKPWIIFSADERVGSLYVHIYDGISVKYKKQKKKEEERLENSGCVVVRRSCTQCNSVTKTEKSQNLLESQTDHFWWLSVPQLFCLCWRALVCIHYTIKHCFVWTDTLFLVNQALLCLDWHPLCCQSSTALSGLTPSLLSIKHCMPGLTPSFLSIKHCFVWTDTLFLVNQALLCLDGHPLCCQSSTALFGLTPSFLSIKHCFVWTDTLFVVNQALYAWADTLLAVFI